MATLITIRWRTPPLGAVEERLIVDDDGRARQASDGALDIVLK